MPDPEVAIAAAPRAVLTEVRARHVLRLRSWNTESDGEPQILRVADFELPNVAGAAASGPMRVLCIAPGEWFIVLDEGTPASAREQLASDAVAQHLALVDLSEALATLELRGPGARDILSQGCGLDLHPRVFTLDRCARTRLAQVPVLIDYRHEADRFEMYVGRSYLQYLRAWLVDAGAG